MEPSSSLCPQNLSWIGASHLPIQLGLFLIEEFKLICDRKQYKEPSGYSPGLDKVLIRSRLRLRSLRVLLPIWMSLEVWMLAGNSESGWHCNCAAHCYLNNTPQSSSSLDSLIQIFSKYSSSVYNMPGAVRDAGDTRGERDKQILMELTFLGEGNGTDNKQFKIKSIISDHEINFR